MDYEIGKTTLSGNIEFVKFTSFFSDIISGKIKSFNAKEGTREFIENKKFWFDQGQNLFLFASDSTIQKYNLLKQRLLSHQPNSNNHDAIILYAELMLEMRKDLGHKATACTKDDFLKAILNDWPPK